MMMWSRGSVVNVEMNIEALEGVFEDFVVLVDDFLRAAVFLSGPERNGSAVFIGATYKGNIVAMKALESYKNISWQISASDVSDMKWAVGIW